MGFINETTSSLSDFVTKLNSFLVSEGWTSDELNLAGGEWGISRGTIFVQARWDTGSPNALGLYQSLGFIGVGTLPGNQTDDSGNGAVSGTDATLLTQRNVVITNSPIQYWCFTSNSSPHYAHVVVQITLTTFVHFGFGIIDKIGDWTGGEYCYGHRQQTGFNNSVAILTGTSALLDGGSADGGPPTPSNMEEYGATVHMEGMPNQVGGGSGKWGVALGAQNPANIGTDRAAVARQQLVGGFRGSYLARAFGRYQSAPTDGLAPMYPIALWYDDTSNVTVSVTAVSLLGWMQDVRAFNIKDFVGGDIVLVGSDEWYVFPTYIKGETGALTGTSAHQGIAYKKI